jgi:hypothetical protein
MPLPREKALFSGVQTAHFDQNSAPKPRIFCLSPAQNRALPALSSPP